MSGSNPGAPGGPVTAAVRAFVGKQRKASDLPANFEALAALALSLAGTIDGGGAIIGLAAIAKELRGTLTELVPTDGDDDAAAFLAKIARAAAVGNAKNAKPADVGRRGR